MVKQEYPRPQFVRDEWMSLNGEWEFELDLSASGVERRVFEKDKLDKRITVPFCPESALSGIGYVDFIAGCWYKREVLIPESWLNGRLLLNFGAVNYMCRVYVNGRQACKHIGGHSSFSVDITDFAVPGANTICVGAFSDVRNPLQPTGKQSTRYSSFGCVYTRTTGIWQSVWLEPVPRAYMDSPRITTDTQNARVSVQIGLVGGAGEKRVRAEAVYNGKRVGGCEARARGETAYLTFELDDVRLWNPGAPELYDLELTLYDGERASDRARSYFGMREISLENGSVCINGKPVYMRLVLDQGFYPDGIITSPSDDELKADIQRGIDMGFNGARMHQKVFEARYLYWADKLGYMLWGEYPNWGLSVKDGKGLPNFLNEWTEIMKRDISSPALIGWCPFNETEVMTDPELLRAVYRVTKQIDPSRPVIDTSGWMHCPETDIYDYHDYTQDPAVLAGNAATYASAKRGEPFPKAKSAYLPVNRESEAFVSRGQPIFISEFGGIGWNVNNPESNAWGYGENPSTEHEFLTRIEGQTRALLTTSGICGFCYTQLTDVEQEINGLYTYSRQPKFSEAKISKLFSAKAWNE